MNIEQMKVGFMDVFCYIVSCPRTKEALVIDPAGDEDRVVQRIQQKNEVLPISHIFLDKIIISIIG